MNAEHIAYTAQISSDGMSNASRRMVEFRIRVYGLWMFSKGVMGGFLNFKGRRVKLKSERPQHKYELDCKEKIVFIVDAADEEEAMMKVMMNADYNITQIDSIKCV